MDETLNQTILQLADLITRNSLVQRFHFLQAHNLSHSQMISLFYLGCHSGVSVNAIAKHLGISNPGASQLIDRLVSMNLVERFDSPRDRRKKLLGLSPAGSQLIREAHQANHQWIPRLVASLSADEAAKIRKALEIIFKNMPKIDQWDHPHSGETNA